MRESDLRAQKARAARAPRRLRPPGQQHLRHGRGQNRNAQLLRHADERRGRRRLHPQHEIRRRAAGKYESLRLLRRARGLRTAGIHHENRARRGAGRLRLHPHRLSAVARTADDQRARRGRQRAHPGAVRILCARGYCRPHAQHQDVQQAPEPRADRAGHRHDHVRRPHEAVRPGRERSAQVLRQKGL